MTVTFTALPDLLCERLARTFRPEHLLVTEERVEAVTRPCLPFRSMPSAVVMPRTAADVQEVLAAATAFDVPVWPVSTGKNWGYGERMACYAGGILLLLERMTSIVQVDETLGYAVLEPGVTYAQLNAHLKQTGSRLWADVTGSTPFGSVIGNALDKGRGVTPYADHFGCLCGLDVVLPDGQLLETGGGPQGHNQVRHLYKWGVGPYLDGLFAQSNLGVVVRAGIWLMPAPEAFDFGLFEFTAQPDAMPQFIDDLRELVFARALRSFPHIANDFAMMCIQAQYPHERLQGQPRLSDQAMTQWRESHGVTRWTFAFGMYGSREEVTYQRRKLKEVLGHYGLVRFVGAAAQSTLMGAATRVLAPLINRALGKSEAFAESMLPGIDLYRGIPTEFFVRQAYMRSKQPKPDADIDPARDGFGLIWLAPLVPFASAHVMTTLALAKAICAENEVDFFVEVIIESARTVILLLGVYFDRNDPAHVARAARWHEQARARFESQGYPSYRVNTPSMPGAMASNPRAQALLAQIKLALDPKNIVAPGRYGTPER